MYVCRCDGGKACIVGDLGGLRGAKGGCEGIGGDEEGDEEVRYVLYVEGWDEINEG